MIFFFRHEGSLEPGAMKLRMRQEIRGLRVLGFRV